MNRLLSFSVGQKIAAVCGAAALCLLVLPGSAFGAGANGDTDIQLLVDDAQLDVTAPQTLSVYLGSDGSFITPDADDFCITNNSIVPARVKSYSVYIESNFTGMTKNNYDKYADDEDNAFWMSVKSGADGTLYDLTSAVDALDSGWEMGATGSDSNTLKLTTAGALKNLAGTLKPANDLSTITWTFSAIVDDTE